ncbi:MAG TPA: hypothetical protein VHT73_03295 [Thermodesulfobacteriota bacterium]|nr:hypothetical protein [Thermodesulfobacteriota bacterium]
MKRLFTIATLGLALSFPSLSFAFDYMDLYTKPIVESEARNETNGGNVEKDLMSFYTTPKVANSTESLVTANQKTDNDYISVFGVQIPHSTRLQGISLAL